jgi:hypothetical protein
VSDERTSALSAGVLPPAMELLTAFTQAGGNPEHYWHAVQWVLADVVEAGPDRLAELVLGLCTAGGLLTHELAYRDGTDTTAVLSWLGATAQAAPGG